MKRNEIDRPPSTLVSDAYNAMTSDRSYRKALPQKEAVAELRRGSGSQFDRASPTRSRP